jgi:hypothetical protein
MGASDAMESNILICKNLTGHYWDGHGQRKMKTVGGEEEHLAVIQKLGAGAGEMYYSGSI